MEVEDCGQDDINTTGGAGGDANLRTFRSRAGKPKVVISSLDSDDDDEPEILESNFEAKISNNIKKPQVVKNPLHVTKEPEFIDLTEEDQDMVSEADDSDIIVEGLMEEQSRHMEEDDDDDLPVLVEVPPLSKKDMAEDHRKVGNNHFKLAEYNQALAAYNRALDLLPTEASYYGNRAACLMMMKRFSEALYDSQQSLKIDPTYEKSYLRIVRANLSLGDVTACETAIQQYDRLCRGMTDISSEKQKLQDLKRFLADMKASTSRKDYRRVLFLCDRVLEIANGDMDNKIRKGYMLTKLGRHNEAADVATDIMTVDGHNVDAHVIKALCHYQLDNMEKSLSFFRGALQRSPDAVEPKVLYKQVKQVKEQRETASELYTQGKYEESKALYLECVKLVRGDDDNLKNTCLESKFNFNLSLIYNQQRMYDDALQFANRAIEINPSYYKAYTHRGRIHNTKELYEEAVRDFEAALKLDPTKRDVLRNDIQNAKIAAKRAKRKDYYKILDIPKGATDNDIRKAYKKRALLHHPDRHAGATESVQKEQEKNFKDVGEAYEVLSDPKKRFRYDQGQDLDASSAGSSFTDPYDANQLFQMFFSSGGMNGGGGGGRAHGPRYYSSNAGRGGCSYGGFQR